MEDRLEGILLRHHRFHRPLCIRVSSRYPAGRHDGGEASRVEIIIAYCIVIAATYLLACGIAGYLFRPLKMWERIACYVVAFIFILPSSMSDIIGIAGCALIMAYCFMTGKKNANKAQPA